MIRRTIAFVAGLALASQALGQWTTVGNDIFNTNTGLVGIGIDPWRAELHVSSTDMDGLWSETTLNGGYAIVGYSPLTTGGSRGVLGWSQGPSGIGVYGLAGSTTGANIGVYGHTNSDQGNGIQAKFAHATGTGIALAAVSNSPNAFAVFANGGKNYFSGNTGIGTQSPTALLHVAGTARFSSLGTSSTNTQVITADVNGNLTRQTLAPMSGVKEFRTAGTSTWSKPAGVTRVRAKLWGGGGGSGDGFGPGSDLTGGSGAYVEAVIDVSAISTLTISVGAGGVPGAAGGGGDTTLMNGATLLLRAGGGATGEPTHGAGGTTFVAAGITNFIAQNGLAGVDSSPPYEIVFTAPPYPGPTLQGPGSFFVSVGTGSPYPASGIPGAVILEW